MNEVITNDIQWLPHFSPQKYQFFNLDQNQSSMWTNHGKRMHTYNISQDGTVKS